MKVHLDERGDPHSIDAEGWYARILQHEIDHLQGHFYIDRIESRTLTSLENLSCFWKNLLRRVPARARLRDG